MSSGSLPMATYHRTQALGAGSFGSVLTVYNDDGEEFAMKLFEADEDNEDETLELGALLEISILRLLRCSNGHPNIVPMADVRDADGDDEEADESESGAGTAGCLGMTMPLYPLGSLDEAIEHKSPLLLQSRPAKISVAHGLLSAVNYLHENGVMHRDIKADNVMLTEERSSGGTSTTMILKPILIDFSLAKIVNATMYGDPHNVFPTLDEDDPTTHSGQMGTATYMAPEVNLSEPYGLSADLWSVGVVLLEVLQKQTLQAVKATQAEKLIQEGLQKLPTDKQFPTLVRHLLKRDPTARWTARQSLENMSTTLFASSVSKMSQEPTGVPPVAPIRMKEALPFDDNEESEEEENVAPPPNITSSSKKKKNHKKKVDAVVERRKKKVRQLCNELDCQHPMSIHAAMCYCERMLELDDELDDMSSQTMLDCVLLAHKMFEVHMIDLTEVESTYKSFSEWSLDEYRDNEATIFMMMDHCLFPRELVDLS